MSIGRRTLLCLAIALSACSAAAQRAVQPPVLGEWRGRSTCLITPSPCNNEVVVYEIRPDSTFGDSLSMQADKIVNGAREDMGTLRCGWHEPDLTCPVRTAGRWRFSQRGDTLSGVLDLADGRRYREALVTRARAP